MRTDLSSLNPPQREAVTHIHGPLLVLAGAGSGKTRVITYRASYLLQVGVPPENILAVSFTNKAAGEMRERVAHLVGKHTAEQLNLSTFHAMGAELMRRYSKHLGYRGAITILDQGDQLSVVKNVMEELNIPKTLKPAELLSLISRAKNAMCDPAGLKQRFNPLIPYAQKIFPAYQRACRSLNAVDFDDLITGPVQLLREHEEVRQRVQERFQFVMVDEYQDTNDTQLALLRLICSPTNNLCVVGDDDQSIYAFRGAVTTHILNFDKEFPGARVIKLEQNYRSTSAILHAANGLIKRNRHRRDKTLWSDLGQGERLQYFQLADENEEAEFVAGDIQRKRREDQRLWSEFAILFRASTLLRPLEEALRSMGIPYQVIGSTQFFDRREVKDLVSYMQAILNPRNEVAIRRIINIPRRGVGTGSLDRLSAWAHERNLSLYDAIQRVDQIEDFGPALRKELRDFHQIIEDYRHRFEAEPLPDALRALLKELDYKDYIQKGEKSPKVAQIRLENIDQLVESVEAFQQRQGHALGNRLESWLSRLMLDGGANTNTKAEEQPEAVYLMTLHASKGLEFPEVYLVGFEEELLPHTRSMQPGQDGDLEEERRLAYVGITRAKKRMVLTSAYRRGRGQAARKRTPSRFLAEIPPELLVQNLHTPGEVRVPQKETRRAFLDKLRSTIFED
jgi:DNA helicase-2/ATP-dependent DNA helicase PcrA